MAAALLATTLLLAGCGDSGEAGDAEATGDAGTTSAPEATDEPDLAAGAQALAGVTLEGDVGSEPTVAFDQPFTIDVPAAVVETEGTGEAIEDGQLLSIQYVAVSGDDGSSLTSTWETGATETLTMGDPSIFPELIAALTGQKVGVRVIFAAPGGEATESSPAFPAAIMALEVIAIAPPPPTPLARAEGAPVEPVAGLPVVTLAETGEPQIDVAGVAAPTELVAQPLITGEGAPVEAGQTVTFHYSGWLLDGTAFDSSWGRGSPFTTPIGTGAVIPGWDQGLVGQTVGSQVLLVIPGDLAYGAAGSGSIPPDATLVFVVDILSAY